MTGYGLGSADSKASEFEVSLRTVNARFLESRLHIPREFIALENDLKKKLSQYFERGTVDLFVVRKFKTSSQAQVRLNQELASEYHQALAAMAKKLKIKTSVSLEMVARLPEVLTLENNSSTVTDQDRKALFKAFEQACKACEAERIREGESVQKNLLQLLDQLTLQVQQMSELREEANNSLLQRFETKIKSRLQSLSNPMELDSSRISQEIVLQLEKSDINEELSRLQEHIKNYRDLLKSNLAQGKKLDFYTQELLREVNTMGSKSGLSKLTQIVVEAKTSIERLREQVQNVE